MQAMLILANVFGGWGFVELLVVLMVGLLIFGKRLPEVGRSLGKSITEFKKGMNGVADSATVGMVDEVTVRPVSPARVAQLPAEEPAKDPQQVQDRIAKLTAELQTLQQEVNQQRATQPGSASK